MSRTRLAALAAAVPLVLAACVGCAAGSNAVDQTAGDQFHFVSGTRAGSLIPKGDRKPVGDFTGTELDGKNFDLASTRGKVTVVNFWATWCSPCVVETPQFQNVYAAYKNKGVDFVGVDTKESSEGAPRAFVKRYGITYPIVFDEEGRAAIELGKIPALGLPFTVIIDSAHRVAGVYLQQLSPKDLEPVLNTLLAERHTGTGG